MNKFIFSVLIALMLFAPALIAPVDAQLPTCNPPTLITNCAPPATVTNVAGIMKILTNIFGFFFGLIVVLSSLFLLYAAFLYIISRGDEGKIDKAKTIIIYAVVALIVAALAWAIPTIVSNFITTGA